MAKIDEIIEEVVKNVLDKIKNIQGQEVPLTLLLPWDGKPETYDSIFERHEGLPKEYFKPSMIEYDPNEIYLSNRKEEISEGLVKTYPTDVTLKHVCSVLNKKGYGITPKSFILNTPNDDKTIYGHILLPVTFDDLSKEADDILRHEFDVCGYYVGSVHNRNVNGKSLIVYQFEPKYQTNYTNQKLGRYLFHVTTDNAAQKILSQGLCPSNRSKGRFSYAGRCYFFTIYNKKLFSNYMRNAKKMNIVGRNISNNNFKILVIDRETLPNLKLFTDPNMLNNIAVFTYDNIPPSSIVDCEDLIIDE